MYPKSLIQPKINSYYSIHDRYYNYISKHVCLLCLVFVIISLGMEKTQLAYILSIRLYGILVRISCDLHI